MSISVVIPSYNAAAFLPSTIRSLLPQLDHDDEIIIVDDGSTDDTEAVIESLSDERLVYLSQQNSGGPARPRNKGCSAAKGEFIFIFDSDDLALQGKLKTSVKAMRDNPSAGFLFTNFNMIGADSEIVSERYTDRYSALSELLVNRVGDDLFYIPGDQLLSALFQANFVGTSSVLMRRSALDRTTGFDEDLSNLDDRDMWLQLSLVTDALYLDKSLHSYRNRADSISKQRIRNQLLERLVVANKFKDRGLTKRHIQHINQFLAKNYLKLGYLDFHERGDRSGALIWFFNSFVRNPSIPALKGVTKSLLPNWLYSVFR